MCFAGTASFVGYNRLSQICTIGIIFVFLESTFSKIQLDGDTCSFLFVVTLDGKHRWRASTTSTAATVHDEGKHVQCDTVSTCGCRACMFSFLDLGGEERDGKGRIGRLKRLTGRNFGPVRWYLVVAKNKCG